MLFSSTVCFETDSELMDDSYLKWVWIRFRWSTWTRAASWMQWVDWAGWRCTNSTAIDGGCVEWTLRPRTAPGSNCNCRLIAWPVHLMALLYSNQHRATQSFLFFFLKKSQILLFFIFFISSGLLEYCNLFPFTSLPLIDGDWNALCSLQSKDLFTLQIRLHENRRAI